MKKIGILTLCAMCAFLLSSCGKDYKAFVGTWGVEKIEYYNVDYAGNPIAATTETHNYDPNDLDDGIQLIFRDDKSGEMRDSNIDTVWVWNWDTEAYDTWIYNPDTTMVYTFTYSYDKSASVLYMSVKYTYPYERIRTYGMTIYDLTDNSFSYENEYDIDYMERAYLRRLSNAPSKSTGKVKTTRPHKPGSLLGDR